MNVKVKGILQNFSFETGEQHNYLRLELPNGKTVDAFVEEDVAQIVTEAFVRQEDPAQRVVAAVAPVLEPSIPVSFPSSDSERVAREFSPLSVEGGDPFGDVVVFGEEPAVPVVPQQAPTAVEPTWSNAKRPEPVVREAPGRVAADEHGYPVSRGSGRIDVAALKGGDGDGEEDGIGQV
jgi:hypothetical protein